MATSGKRLGHDTLPVRYERCDECLFSPNKIVSTRRMMNILATCERNGSHFECHKETIAGRHGMCRGFYDREPYATMLMRVAAMTCRVEFVDEDGQPVACPIPQGAHRKR